MSGGGLGRFIVDEVSDLRNDPQFARRQQRVQAPLAGQIADIVALGSNEEHGHAEGVRKLGNVVADARTEGLEDHLAVREGTEVAVVLIVDESAACTIAGLGHDDRHGPHDDRVREQQMTGPLRKCRAEAVVEHGESREKAARTRERRRGDRVDEDDTLRLQPGRDRGGHNERAERVAKDHGRIRKLERIDEGSEPGGVGGERVLVVGKAVRRAETGQIGGDDPETAQLRHDGFEPVVVTAESVHENDGRIIRPAVLAPTGQCAVNAELSDPLGETVELLGEG